MKKLFSTAKHALLTDFWIVTLRISSGAFMLTHGLPKLNKLLDGGEISFYDPIGFGPGFALALTVLAEVCCSFLVMIGLLTRVSSALLVITMAVAAFMAHAGDPFKSKEMALMYLLVFATTLVSGGGRFSIDFLISGKK